MKRSSVERVVCEGSRAVVGVEDDRCPTCGRRVGTRRYRPLGLDYHGPSGATLDPHYTRPLCVTGVEETSRPDSADRSWWVSVEGEPSPLRVLLIRGRRKRMAFARRGQVGYEWFAEVRQPNGRTDCEPGRSGMGAIAVLRACRWDV